MTVFDSPKFYAIPTSAPLQQAAPGAQLWGCLLSVEPKAGAQLDLSELWSKLRERWRGTSRGQLWSDPVAQAFVEFFRAVGVNASRKRPPSALNLVQRFVLSDAPHQIRFIHPLVDAGNLASAESLIPVAVLDASTIDGQPLLDLSHDGDQFCGFGMETPEELPTGTPVLRDGSRLLSVFCYRDGQATAVTTNTRQIWLLACQVKEVEEIRVLEALRRTAELMSVTHELKQ